MKPIYIAVESDVGFVVDKSAVGFTIEWVVGYIEGSVAESLAGWLVSLILHHL